MHLHIILFFLRGGGFDLEFNLGGESRSEHHLHPKQEVHPHPWMYTCTVGEPQAENFLFLFIIYLSMVTFALYFISLFTPLQFVLSEGEGVRIPATSYLVSLFTLIDLVLFHLLLLSCLDVPCYLNNRQRYCSVWPERELDSL